LNSIIAGIDLNGTGNASFPLFEAFSSFLQLLQMWLRANRRWRRPIRSTVAAGKKGPQRNFNAFNISELTRLWLGRAT